MRLVSATFGGFTSAMSEYLIHISDNRAMPGSLLSFAALCGLVAALALKRVSRAGPATA